SPRTAADDHEGERRRLYEYVLTASPVRRVAPGVADGNPDGVPRRRDPAQHPCVAAEPDSSDRTSGGRVELRDREVAAVADPHRAGGDGEVLRLVVGERELIDDALQVRVDLDEGPRGGDRPDAAAADGDRERAPTVAGADTARARAPRAAGADADGAARSCPRPHDRAPRRPRTAVGRADPRGAEAEGDRGR